MLSNKSTFFPFGMLSKSYENGYRFGFNGQEKDDEVYGIGNSYTAEFWQYDPRLGRRWNNDPVDKPWMSPYHAFSNKPILNIDPNGNSDSPIYNTEGELLGTDDEGLQGEPLVLNESDFTQGMSHEEAKEKNLGLEQLNDQEARDKYEETQKSLPNRPDYDGKVSFKEAIDWYNSGSGNPLFVDLSKINFKNSNLSVEDFRNNNTSNLSVNFFAVYNNKKSYTNILWRPSKDYDLANVFGTVSVNLLDSKKGIIKLKTYKDYNGGIDRFDFSNKFFLFIADFLKSGDPKPFNIMGYGKGKINIKSKSELFNEIEWVLYKL